MKSSAGGMYNKSVVTSSCKTIPQSLCQERRLAHIDIAKGIAIIAVVILHVDYEFPSSQMFYTDKLLGWAWHVPVFFLLGGFFLKEDRLLKPVSFIKAKVKSLYLLALYIYLPATLLHNFFLNVGWYDSSVDYSGKQMLFWNAKDYAIGIVKTLLCAGREPIMGAMWFVYVLLFSLCGYSIVSWIVKKMVKTEKQYEGARVIVLLTLQIMSCVATNVFDFTIPRFSNAISVMLLLWVGQQMNSKWKLDFNNGWICIVCMLIVYQCTILLENEGYIGLNNNAFRDVLQLTVGCSAALYVVCYISKKMDGTVLGKHIRQCGKDSFYIMGLHIVGFRLCTMILISLGIVDGGLAELMTPKLNNIFLLLMYTAFGILLPMLAITVFRKGKDKILKSI